MSTKRTYHLFLTLECGMYLPAEETISMNFLKEVSRGEKKVRSII